jgi:hypothetical protein
MIFLGLMIMTTTASQSPHDPILWILTGGGGGRMEQSRLRREAGI